MRKGMKERQVPESLLRETKVSSHEPRSKRNRGETKEKGMGKSEDRSCRAFDGLAEFARNDKTPERELLRKTKGVGMPASDASWVLVGRYLGLIRSTVVKTGCNPAVREEVEEKCVLRLYQKVASFNFEEADPDTATPFAAYAKAIVPSYARSQASILGKRYSIVYPDIAPCIDDDDSDGNDQEKAIDRIALASGSDKQRSAESEAMEDEAKRKVRQGVEACPDIARQAIKIRYGFPPYKLPANGGKTKRTNDEVAAILGNEGVAHMTGEGVRMCIKSALGRPDIKKLLKEAKDLRS